MSCQKKVVVIGAGPSGCAVAIMLKQSGFDVTLIDKVNFPRGAPGETVHPGIIPILSQLGILDAIDKAQFLRPKGIWNIDPQKSIFTYFDESKKWLGYQLIRDKFDYILLQYAISLGVKFVVTHTSSFSLIKEHGYIRAIQYDDVLFEADFFIDATGTHACLAKKLGISYSIHSKKLIALYGYLLSDNNDLIDPKLIWDEYGWTWITSVQESLIGWVRLNIQENQLPFSKWFPFNMEKFKEVGQVLNEVDRYDCVW